MIELRTLNAWGTLLAILFSAGCGKAPAPARPEVEPDHAAPAPHPRAAEPDHAEPAAWVTVTFASMGTRMSAMVPTEHEAIARRIVPPTFDEVDREASEWKATSPLSAVNDAAGRDFVAVPPGLFALVRRGLEIARVTDGAFDVTWAALWGLWDFKASPPRVPSDEEIAARIDLVDHTQVEVDEAGSRLRLPRAGMKIGLGGIGKGYALDLAARRLREAGVNDFLLSAGGQVYAAGTHGGRPWRVGIRDPRGVQDDHFALVEVRDASVSTSGDYERFFVVDGVRHHHILDPRTGRPSRGLRSATAIAADATLADALSTAFMVLGRERTFTALERFPGVEVVLVDDDAAVHTSPGLKDRLLMRHEPLR